MSILDALDERARRRPSWRPGAPTRLCNGQLWHLAATALRHQPVAAPGGMFLLPTIALDGQPPGYEDLDDCLDGIEAEILRLDGRADAEAVAERHLAYCRAALPRLATLYDVDDREAVRLLVPSVDLLRRDPAAAAGVMADVAEAVGRDLIRRAEAIGAVVASLGN